MFSFTVVLLLFVCLFVGGAGVKMGHRRQIWGALQ